jgi:hypothetical protein
VSGKRDPTNHFARHATGALALFALLPLLPAPAAALDVRVPDPGFTVTVPRLPDLQIRPAAAQASGSALRMTGGDGTIEVSVFVQAMQRPVSARECAGSGLRTILSQPGMPSRDNVYRAPLSETTFLVLYVIAGARQPTLHAHLLSAVVGTHGAEAHFSRLAGAGVDHDDWRQTFSGARIVDAAR